MPNCEDCTLWPKGGVGETEGLVGPSEDAMYGLTAVGAVPPRDGGFAPCMTALTRLAICWSCHCSACFSSLLIINGLLPACSSCLFLHLSSSKLRSPTRSLALHLAWA